ncbi:hypothetical protein FRX31_019597 [Thalictrum thalictroides]|uniref:Uncharacterized protein n=1 Tax=Thalictrum thalictroides TaxID=46969 RepID=A0A7J6W0C3_THATH|nr:hypothetical protein FRX31_019597 [Thalictrum thalictroides]
MNEKLASYHDKFCSIYHSAADSDSVLRSFHYLLEARKLSYIAESGGRWRDLDKLLLQPGNIVSRPKFRTRSQGHSVFHL